MHPEAEGYLLSLIERASDGRMPAPIGDDQAPAARPVRKRPAAEIAARHGGEPLQKRPKQSLLPSERAWLLSAFAATAPHGGLIQDAELDRIRRVGQDSEPPQLSRGVTAAQVRYVERFRRVAAVPPAPQQEWLLWQIHWLSWGSRKAHSIDAPWSWWHFGLY